MDFLSKLAIRATCRAVGRDEFGNRYYETRQSRAQRALMQQSLIQQPGARQSRIGKAPRRYVIFNGQVEASRVPADWHGWLHYTEASPPPEKGYAQHDWQLPHLPNLTGTHYAYRPAGHVLKGGKRAKASGDYEAWTPPTNE